MDKPTLRKQAHHHFKTMSDDVYLSRTKDILEMIMNYEPFLKANKVGIYYPIGKEINLLILMHLYPAKTFYFPRLEGKTLSFREIKDINSLEPTRFHLKQPTKKERIEKDIDIYFVPCVLTSGNYRIGHGAGFYDHYFKDHQGHKVGIVHLGLKDVSAKIDPYDIPMDVIL